MVRAIVQPWPTTEAVEVGGWYVQLRDQFIPVPDLLAGWDYQTSLRFHCTVRVDADRIRQDCHLANDADLSIVVQWDCPTTLHRSMAFMTPVGTTSGLSAAVETGSGMAGEKVVAFEVPAGTVGGTLRLERLLVLGEPGRRADGLGAGIRGAVLWREPAGQCTRVVLEGDRARFPTELVDFATTTIRDNRALWWLRSDLNDLDAAPLTAMRLYLNTGNSAVRGLLTDRPDPASHILQEALRWDVHRQLITLALDSDEFCERVGRFADESVGHLLESLLNRMWPDRDARSLRIMRHDRPGQFEATLQARVGLLAGER